MNTPGVLATVDRNRVMSGAARSTGSGPVPVSPTVDGTQVDSVPAFQSFGTEAVMLPVALATVAKFDGTVGFGEVFGFPPPPPLKIVPANRPPTTATARTPRLGWSRQGAGTRAAVVPMSSGEPCGPPGTGGGPCCAPARGGGGPCWAPGRGGGGPCWAPYPTPGRSWAVFGASPRGAGG